MADHLANDFYYKNKTYLDAFYLAVMKRKLVKTKQSKSTIQQELTILKLICREYNNEEIGKKIGLSKRRVEGIRLELLKKTNSKNVVGLVKYAIKKGIYHIKVSKTL